MTSDIFKLKWNQSIRTEEYPIKQTKLGKSGLGLGKSAPELAEITQQVMTECHWNSGFLTYKCLESFLFCPVA